jgi:hypothetical protein
MKELFGVAHIRDNEEEVPNTKGMRVVEEEVSLSQPKTVAPPPEEEDVIVPKGPSVAVLPEEEVPSEEDEFPALTVTVPQGPCCGPAGVGRKGMPCPCTGLGKFFALLFFSKTQEILLALFSHKCGRFIGLEPDLC